MDDVRAVVLDIEGTVLSISFVRDTLFPYAKENLGKYLKDHWNEPELMKVVDELRVQAENDLKSGQYNSVPNIPPAAQGDGSLDKSDLLLKSVEANVLWQMDHDRKTAALKTLQGLIWLQGYCDTRLVAPLYEDVVPALEKWKIEGKRIFIYSSGSIQAQQLLFSHTTRGNVCNLLDGYFDIVTSGNKMQPASYTNISESIGLPSSRILFLTDVVAEAQAARAAGMQSRLVVRPGNSPLTDDEKITYQYVSSFSEL
ncbi:enolase-phosphatase E1-like isoform X1 [Ornithodoros turicata]|uniref:enolase-phosphatase E1-like isoform X1 n=2 Tax=Ornithodoros turicata TaxID=34597 RepID=UPI003138E336